MGVESPHRDRVVDREKGEVTSYEGEGGRAVAHKGSEVENDCPRI